MSRRMGEAVLVGLFLVIVTNFGVLLQLDNRDEVIDQTSTHVDDVSEQVDEVKVFVDDLQEITPEEEDRNAAVTAAVRQVPEIKSILCQAFPEVPDCSEDLG